MTQALDYRAAGVDIDRGNELITDIKPIVAATKRPGVLGSLGGFGGLFEIPEGYKKPVLVSGTDGVGTKLRVAIDTNTYSGVGIDLVAMCVNDILVTGAEPLFFLDYYATGKLDNAVAVDVIKGIAEGCKQSGAALIGGETAEMPGMYENGDFDLAGFCVGIVEKDQMIDGSQVKAGSRLIGLASSGPHSNGYSLIRKVIEVNNLQLDQAFGDSTLGETLLAPTQIYVKALLPLMQNGVVQAAAHITGGGLPENLPRVLPEGLGAHIQRNSWDQPEIFAFLQEQGGIADAELLRTFNCGIGMVLVIDEAQYPAVAAAMDAENIAHWDIGEVTAEAGIQIS